MKISNKYIRISLPVVAGAAIGYAYYYFIGCTTGSCPLTSNPYVSTLYGSAVGFVMALPGKKKKSEKESQS